MLPRKFLVLLLIAFAMSSATQAGPDETDIENSSEVRDKYLVILYAQREFNSAKREADRVSILSGIQFSMNGRIWDPNRGLILPDNCDDPIYCGEYLPRRYNELHLTAADPGGYISIEKSEAYPNLEKGYYIALAAIRESNQEAEQELLKFKTFAPKAYVAKTEIYMGCIH
jgi:hypothetical protein